MQDLQTFFLGKPARIVAGEFLEAKFSS